MCRNKIYRLLCAFIQCERVQPYLLLSKPLPDWLEARLADMAAELDLPLKVCDISVSQSFSVCFFVCLSVCLLSIYLPAHRYNTRYIFVCIVLSPPIYL